MAKLETFLHGEPEPTPILVRAAMSHAQFETIHPFLDGNGRVGRLLITLLLVAEDVLKRPLLYLSLYLKQNRDDYYDHLLRIRTDGRGSRGSASSSRVWSKSPRRQRQPPATWST